MSDKRQRLTPVWLSSEDLADLFSVSPDTVCRWLKKWGDKIPSCQKLNISKKTLLGRWRYKIEVVNFLEEQIRNEHDD